MLTKVLALFGGAGSIGILGVGTNGGRVDDLNVLVVEMKLFGGV